MIAYDASEQADRWLALWWANMGMQHEFAQTFDASLAPLGAFMQHWRGRRTLLLWVEDDAPWLAMWFEPVFDGAYTGLWLRHDYRQFGRSRTALRAIREGYSWALDQWPVLIASTCQPKLVRTLTRLGYNEGMTVPRLWNGQDVSVLTLEKLR